MFKGFNSFSLPPELSGLSSHGVKPFPSILKPNISVIPNFNTNFDKSPLNRTVNITNPKPCLMFPDTDPSKSKSMNSSLCSAWSRENFRSKTALPQKGHLSKDTNHSHLYQKMDNLGISSQPQHRIEGSHCLMQPRIFAESIPRSVSHEYGNFGPSLGKVHANKLYYGVSKSDPSQNIIKNDPNHSNIFGGSPFTVCCVANLSGKIISPPTTVMACQQGWQATQTSGFPVPECCQQISHHHHQHHHHHHRFQGIKPKGKNTILEPIAEVSELSGTCGLPAFNSDKELHLEEKKFESRKSKKHHHQDPFLEKKIRKHKRHSFSPFISSLLKEGILPAALLKLLQGEECTTDSGSISSDDDELKAREAKFKEELGTLLEVLTLPSRQKELLDHTGEDFLNTEENKVTTKGDLIEQAKSMAVEHEFPTNLTITDEDQLIPSSRCSQQSRSSDYQIIDRNKILLNALPQTEIYRSSSITDVQPNGGEKLRFFLVDDEKFFARPQTNLRKATHQRKNIIHRNRLPSNKNWYNASDLNSSKDSKAISQLGSDRDYYRDRPNAIKAITFNENKEPKKKNTEKPVCKASLTVDKNENNGALLQQQRGIEPIDHSSAEQILTDVEQPTKTSQNTFTNSEAKITRKESFSSDFRSKFGLNEEKEDIHLKKDIEKEGQRKIIEQEELKVDETSAKQTQESSKICSRTDNKRKRLVRWAKIDKQPYFPTIESKTQFFEQLNANKLAKKSTSSKPGKFKDHDQPLSRQDSEDQQKMMGNNVMDKSKMELPNYLQPKFFEDVTKIGSRDVTQGVMKCMPKEVKMFYPQSFIKCKSKDAMQTDDDNTIHDALKSKNSTKETNQDVGKEKSGIGTKYNDEQLDTDSFQKGIQSESIKLVKQHSAQNTLHDTKDNTEPLWSKDKTRKTQNEIKYASKETFTSSGSINLIKVGNDTASKHQEEISESQTNLEKGSIHSYQLGEDEHVEKMGSYPNQPKVRIMRSISTQSDDSFVGDTSETLSVGEDSDFSDGGAKDPSACKNLPVKISKDLGTLSKPDITSSVYTAPRFHRKRHSSSTQNSSKKMESRGTQTCWETKGDLSDSRPHLENPHQILVSSGEDYCRNCGASLCSTFDEQNMLNTFCPSCFAHGNFHSGGISNYGSPIYLTQSRCTTPTFDQPSLPESLHHPTYLSPIQPQGSPIRLPLGMSLCPLGSTFTPVVSPLRSPVSSHSRSVHSRLGEYRVA